MINPYTIVTEFRFDIAHAVADSKALQGAVGQISESANQALYNLRRVGMSLVAQMGLFSGGTLSFLYNAIQSSEKFNQSQRDLANVLFTNRSNMNMMGMTFVDSMKMSADLIDKIGKKGAEFALDPSQMLSQTKAIAPMLLSHKLDDSHLSNSIDIARGLLKSSTTLGIDPTLVQGQLINLVSGRASLSDTLFQRLMAETQAFRDKKINDSKSFNTMDAHKRIEMVRQALLQFGSTSEVIEGNINSLNGMMTTFKALMSGAFSILKPLGDALMVPIRQIFKYVNTWLDTQGRQIIKNMSSVLGDFLKDPVEAFVKLKQLSTLKSDLSLAGKVAGFVGMYEAVRGVLTLFGVQLMGFGAGLRLVFGYLRAGFTWLAAALPWGAIFSFLGRMIVTAISQIAGVLLPLLFFLQLFSQTMAKVQVIWAQWMASNAGRMSEVLTRIFEAASRIFLPIQMAMDALSDIFANLIGWFVTKEIILTFFEMLAGTLENIALVIVMAISTINGAVGALFSMISDAMNMNFSGIFDRAGKEFEDSWADFYKKAYKIKDTEMPAISGQTTIINGGVNINQNIKEQVEPDRIAFAAVSAFSKVAMNPTQSSGRRSKAGMVGQ